MRAVLLLAAGLAAAEAPVGVAADERGPAPAPPPAAARWLVGDLHVHVSPPDAPGHSTLDVAAALAAARRGGLDFVALTPHDADGLRDAPAGAEPTRETGQQLVRRLLRDAAATRADEPPLLAVAGWEWTREEPGHLGLLFADVAALRGVDAPRRARAALDAGALAVVEHPFLRPVRSDLPVMGLLRADRSWRPFVAGEFAPGDWNSIEVWHDGAARVQALHARDAERLPDTQMIRRALEAWDAATLAGRRRIVAVGGSDAHGRLPYTALPLPVVSVLVDGADEDALRRGLLAAHVTFGRRGGAAARSFAATSDAPGARAGVGDALRATREVHLTWDGEATLYENGTRVGVFDGGTTRTLAASDAFAFWRIECAGDAYSNMIYANLP